MVLGVLLSDVDVEKYAVSRTSLQTDVAGARLNGQLYGETKLQVCGGRCYSDSRILVRVQVDVILQPPVRPKPTTVDGAMPTEARGIIII